MAKEEKKKPSEDYQPPVLGKLYEPTVDGFNQFIAEAIVMESGGYTLANLVRLESKLAAVFRLVKPKKHIYNSLLEEDEEEP